MTRFSDAVSTLHKYSGIVALHIFWLTVERTLSLCQNIKKMRWFYLHTIKNTVGGTATEKGPAYSLRPYHP